MVIQEELKCRKCCNPDTRFSLGIRAGDYIYTSGILPFDAKTDLLVSDDFNDQARKCFENIENLLKETGLSRKHIMKVTVYLTDMDNMQAFSVIFNEFFENPHPASTLIGAADLPMHAKICIEAYAVDTRALEVLMENSHSCNDKVCEIGYE